MTKPDLRHWVDEIENSSKSVSGCVLDIYDEGFDAGKISAEEIIEAAKVTCSTAREIYSSVDFMDLPELRGERLCGLGRVINDLADTLGLNKEEEPPFRTVGEYRDRDNERWKEVAQVPGLMQGKTQSITFVVEDCAAPERRFWGADLYYGLDDGPGTDEALVWDRMEEARSFKRQQ